MSKPCYPGNLFVSTETLLWQFCIPASKPNSTFNALLWEISKVLELFTSGLKGYAVTEFLALPIY